MRRLLVLLSVLMLLPVGVSAQEREPSTALQIMMVWTENQAFVDALNAYTDGGAQVGDAINLITTASDFRVSLARLYPYAECARAWAEHTDEMLRLLQLGVMQKVAGLDALATLTLKQVVDVQAQMEQEQPTTTGCL